MVLNLVNILDTSEFAKINKVIGKLPNTVCKLTNSEGVFFPICAFDKIEAADV